MRIEKIPVNKINPAKYNPRKDLQSDDPEYKKLAKSIREFSLVEPLIWNEKTSNLVGGHQRLKILKELGYTEVEVSIVNISESREKALNIALNKIQGNWDYPKLKDLLQDLDTGEIDMEVTGFDIKEIEDLMTQFLKWLPEGNLIEGEGELARRVIITFRNETEELEFWIKFGKDHIPTNRVLFRWSDINA